MRPEAQHRNSDGKTAFVYDSENRLVSASGESNASLADDPLGRLWQPSGPAGIARFVYDGDRPVEEKTGAVAMVLTGDKVPPWTT